jgi:hypothetical protein
MRKFLGLGLIALLCACESPAASTTLNVRVSEIGPRDVSNGQLSAMVQISGTCSQGPCDPNPCTEDAKTRCLAQGTVFRCDCPAGTSLTAEGECMPDTGCTPTFCGGNGLCESVEGVPGCNCSVGYTGTNCELCDNAAGFYSDGFGGCTDVFDVCRAGQGIDAWNQMMAEAEETLGHPASEIELVKATLRTVEGEVSGARSWPYLWTDEVQLVFEPTDEPFIDAGVAKIPAQAEGLRPLEFDVSIERPTFTRQPKFYSGDFSVGLRGPTERKGSEPFALDTEIVLEFEVY